MKGIVWGLTMERAQNKFWSIVEDYKRIGINPVRVSSGSSSTFATFENGDHWMAVRASENQRGRATNISYIDDEIPQEVINCIIKPCTKAYPFQAINYYWVGRIE